MALKRYLLFSGQCYYPLGGWCDFQGDYDTEEEPKGIAQAAYDKIASRDQYDFWSEVVDTDTMASVTGHISNKNVT